MLGEPHLVATACHTCYIGMCVCSVFTWSRERRVWEVRCSIMHGKFHALRALQLINICVFDTHKETVGELTVLNVCAIRHCPAQGSCHWCKPALNVSISWVPWQCSLVSTADLHTITVSYSDKGVRGRNQRELLGNQEINTFKSVGFYRNFVAWMWYLSVCTKTVILL